MRRRVSCDSHVRQSDLVSRRRSGYVAQARRRFCRAARLNPRTGVRAGGGGRRCTANRTAIEPPVCARGLPSSCLGRPVEIFYSRRVCGEAVVRHGGSFTAPERVPYFAPRQRFSVRAAMSRAPAGLSCRQGRPGPEHSECARRAEPLRHRLESRGARGADFERPILPQGHAGRLPPGPFRAVYPAQCRGSGHTLPRIRWPNCDPRHGAVTELFYISR